MSKAVESKYVGRALVVGVQYQRSEPEEVASLLSELGELVETLDIAVVEKRIVKLREPKSRYLLGEGKVHEFADFVESHDCDVIVFDEDLSPAQQRNWETRTGVAVIDRQEVILEIFARRARTREAVLQVALARMEYSLPRLKRAWTHLSRQRGGGTTQRGAGETQLETDQRLVRDRIGQLKKELKDVVRNRRVQRQRRSKLPTPAAAIVGYTNAGKSSLLNRLTGAGVLVEDKLFATLDSTTRRLNLPGGHPLLLSDTVGFVRKLPHHLVEAFKATLEETLVSNFLIHILDVSSPEVEKHYETTMKVLEELGAEKKRILVVFNKIDLEARVDIENLVKHKALRGRHPDAVFISTTTGEGIDDLLKQMEKMLEEEFVPMELIIPHFRYDLINRLHELGCVRRETVRDDGVLIEGNIPSSIAHELISFSEGGR